MIRGDQPTLATRLNLISYPKSSMDPAVTTVFSVQNAVSVRSIKIGSSRAAAVRSGGICPIPDQTASIAGRYHHRNQSIRRGLPMKSTVPFLFALLIGATLAPAASAQGLDDLFSASPQRDTPQRNAERLALPPMTPAVADAESDPVNSPSDRKLVHAPGSTAEQMPSMAMQLRQARALEASRQRQARLEASYWASNPNLRPAWDSNFGQNQYRNRIIYYVPAYYHNR